MSFSIGPNLRRISIRPRESWLMDFAMPDEKVSFVGEIADKLRGISDNAAYYCFETERKVLELLEEPFGIKIDREKNEQALV